MEQQKKKKRKHQRGRRQSKSTSSLSNDLTAQILSWLPEKSVARFSCVSKLWLSITTDRYFINLSETRFPRESLLLCLAHGNNLFVASIPQHAKSWNKFYSSSQPIHCYHMKLSQECDLYPYGIESVYGLVCFTESRPLVVLNPRTRKFLTLSNPKMNSSHMFFGYDPIEGKHKVMCLPCEETCYECRVLTLGSGQGSWRTVRTNCEHRCGYSPGRCIKGVIYYVARSGMRLNFAIMSFDVRSEKLHLIELPSGIGWDVLIITYKGRLAYADRNIKTRLWILEDTEKHKWSFQDFLSPFCHNDPILGIWFTLKGCTHTGEFISVPNSRFHKSFYILFYDPVRNSCRRLELEGIVDDQSGFYNGVANGLTYSLNVCPNHIGSQMSL